MRIAIHDYCGHPFQVELSRKLAENGHQVTHFYCSSNPTTPQGKLERSADDPAGFRIVPVPLPKDIEKGRFIDRWKLERLYGQRLRDAIMQTSPEVVISANTPLDAQAKIQQACAAQATPFVYWVQDLIGEAATRILRKKLPFGGGAIGAYYRAKEKRLLRNSDHVIGITRDFEGYFAQARVAKESITTIPNWSPLGEVVPGRKNNSWAQRQGLVDKFVFLYSGTLGFKHNPRLFLELASKMCSNEDVRVVVNSQGEAAEWLKKEAALKNLSNLLVNPFQPYSEMSDVLATADVLLAVLEPEAGRYSVPSKVLSYHCAGRPMLLAVPSENLVARIVLEEGTGLVADPQDVAGLCVPALRLYNDAPGREAMASKARNYAEEHFDSAKIASRFEEILQKVAG